MQEKCPFNTSLTMTPIKDRKRQKFAYCIFARKISCNYYARDAMLARVMAIVTCLCVCPPVRPSRADIVSK